MLRIIVAVLCASCALWAQDLSSSAMPDRFIVARHTFFDFGPPSDFYEIFVVNADSAGSSIEKITLTPGAECYLSAKYEYTSAKSLDPVAALLEKNPCSIPEKQIQRELKRKKKHQLVFSGANVVIQLQCGKQLRMIRADFLDRDLFDSNPDTPQHTSWTMRLLRRLDAAAGPNVMDKPSSPVDDTEAPPPYSRRTSVQQLASGDFDALFEGAPDRPSEILRQSQLKTAQASVSITRIEPIKPEGVSELKYPPLAKAARIQGSVEFKARIQPDGMVDSVEIVSGHPMLIPAAKEAIKSLKFARAGLQPEVVGTIEFNLNCSPGDYHRDPVQKVTR